MPSRIHLLLAILLAPQYSSFAATLVLEAAADTTLFEPASDNNLGSGTLAIGVTNGNQRARGLLRFDVAGALPAGATIHSAVLTLTANRESRISSKAVTLQVHRALIAWQEGSGTDSVGAPASPGDATWNRRAHPAVTWGQPGGQSGVDYAASASAAALLPEGDIGLITWNSTAAFVDDVQLWLDQPATNQGLFIIAANESATATARRFNSVEDLGPGISPEPPQPPRLTITYAPPAPYDLWLLSLPVPVTPGQTARLDDPDADGLPNFLEYALGGDPMDPANRPAPAIAHTPDTAQLSLAYLRARSELRYSVETCTDLPGASWTTTGVVQDASAAPGTLAVATLTLTAGDNRRFLRLRVTEP